MEWTYRLFKYNYKYYVQGTEEWSTDYALIYAPKDASFNNVRSGLFNAKNKEYYYEIDLESVEDMTIRW